MSRIGNWALLGVVALMGVVLVATVYSTSRGIADASDTLIRGQSSVFRGMIRRLSREPVTQKQLEELLDQHQSDGLRYIAVFDERAVPVSEAGDRPSSREPLLVRGDRFALTKVDGRIRMQVAPPPDRRGQAIVIEFEPRIANELRSGARRSLTIAAIAGVVLLLFAGVLIRWQSRQRKLEAQVIESQRLASLGEMSATLAHEIRNPIASLKGNAQLLVRMLPENDKPHTKAQRVVSEAIRLETLTNDLLEFARSGAIDRQPTSPAELLAEVVERRVDARIQVDAGAAPSTWSLDGRRIVQVLDNLIDNAIEANAEADADEPVAVTIESDRHVLTLRIRDHGEGISADRREAIFAPFETGKTRGTGLGLAVARRIANLHGGDITIEDATGGGAVFVVSLPKGVT